MNYNENFGLHNQCLAFAKSYELLLDVTKGKYYTAPTQDPNWISNEAWSAGLYSVDYSANQVNTVVDTSYNAGNGNHIIFPMTQPAEIADISWNGLYPGVRVDPSYNIFYNRCKDQNYWRKNLVDMSFNNTNYYNQSKDDSEELYGMYYPANVKFNLYPSAVFNNSIHGSATFNYTGTIQTFTKPAGVSVITIEAIGGGGGGSIPGGVTTYGGGGGKVTSSFKVPLCKCSFNIYVGGQGNGFVLGNPIVLGGISLYNYSTNGQTGSGGTVNYVVGTGGSGGGGALSCVIINQQGSTIKREMLIIAGGGGGGADGEFPPSNGGFGGGNGTADGEDAPLYLIPPSTGGKGGKADGTGGAGPNEILTTGGSGGTGGNSGNNVGNGGRNYSNGAGGGGGYGGGGGGYTYNAGGGGSSFSNGYNTTYAYIASHTNVLPGEGGTAGSPKAASGQPGKITITY